MYQAPEVEYLQAAVDAVKRGLVPQKEKEPDTEDTQEEYENEDERPGYPR